MKNKRTKIVGWRVEDKHVTPLTNMVKKFLKSKGYKFYEKENKKAKRA